MINNFLIAALVFLTFLGGGVSYASRSMDAPKCSFIGVVQDVNVRKEDGEGLSKGKSFTYIDVTVDIVKGHMQDATDSLLGCNIEEASRQVFQMQNSILGKYHPHVPKLGACIKGYSQFIGDGNFMSGRWLTVEENLDAASCSLKNN